MNHILLNNAPPLEVTTLVRTVVNQRDVIFGRWSDKPVFAKLFYGNRAVLHHQRDLNGIHALLKAGILTPKVLFTGQTEDGNGLVTLLEAIPNAKNMESSWLDFDYQAQFFWAVSVVKLLAKHHQMGIIQTDMYLKNFLIAGENLYTIDGDGIRVITRLSPQQAVQNLATLLSKFDVIALDSWLPKLIQTYASEISESQSPSLAKLPSSVLLSTKQMLKRIAQLREKTASAYADKKVFRTCTDVRVIKDSTQYGAYSNAFFEGLENKVVPLNIEALEASLNTHQTLKMGNTCTVGLTQLQEKPVVIKRYNIKSFWHGVGRAMRQSRAAVSWANAHRLQLLGIATPQPVALIEQRRIRLLGLTLKGKSYFLSAYVHAPDVAEFFTQTQYKTLRAEAVKQIVQLFYKLHLLQISHGDMKATNIKMLGTKPMLIDLDSMQQHRCTYFAQKAHAKDLRRFMQNWKHDASLYNAFIKVFKVVYADHAPLHAANILK